MKSKGRRTQAALLVAATAALVGAAAAHALGSPGGPGLPAPLVAKLQDAGISPDVYVTVRDAATSFAFGAGEQHPSGVAMVATTRRAAASAGGAWVSSTDAGLMVELHGRFVLNNAPRPDGAPPPVGTELSLVFDEAGHLVDISLGDHEPPAAALGHAVEVAVP